jgi:hypothetical protein
VAPTRRGTAHGLRPHAGQGAHASAVARTGAETGTTTTGAVRRTKPGAGWGRRRQELSKPVRHARLFFPLAPSRPGSGDVGPGRLPGHVALPASAPPPHDTPARKNPGSPSVRMQKPWAWVSKRNRSSRFPGDATEARPAAARPIERARNGRWMLASRRADFQGRKRLT